MILTTSNCWEDPMSTTAICLSPPGVPPRGPSLARVCSPSCSSFRTCPSLRLSFSSFQCPLASLARIIVCKIESFVIKILPLGLFTQFKMLRKREISNYTSNSARACQFAVLQIITRWVTVTHLFY